MKLKIDRNYRNSKALAPYFCWDGDIPRPVFLSLDMETGDAFLAMMPDGGIEIPGELKTFPVDPCLTIHGIDQLFEHPGIQEALEGVLRGDKEAEAYLWEMSSSALYERLEGLRPMTPYQYFQGEVPVLQKGESIEKAAERISQKALEDLVYLRTLDVEFYLEGDE